MPFVENVRWPEVNGSVRSGLEMAFSDFLGDSSARKKGPRERRRIAWVKVGWNRPPNSEC